MFDFIHPCDQEELREMMLVHRTGEGGVGGDENREPCEKLKDLANGERRAKKATLIQRLSQSARRPIYSSLVVSGWEGLRGGGCQRKLLFSHFRPEGTQTWKVASVACQVTVAETAPCIIGF